MVVPLELPPRQELLLRDERLRLRPEERRGRQHDPAAALRRPAKAATGGGRRPPGVDARRRQQTHVVVMVIASRNVRNLQPRLVAAMAINRKN